MLREVQRRGKLSGSDISPMKRAVEASLGTVVTEADEVEEAIEDLFSAGPATTLLGRLPKSMARDLSKSGQVVSVAKGDLLIKDDLYDRVVYCIIEGMFEVRRGKEVIAHCGVGDTVGEVAFFRKGGRRSASVRALTDGRVLFLSRSFLDKLVRHHPAEACQFYEAICQVMAERIAGT